MRPRTATRPFVRLLRVIVPALVIYAAFGLWAVSLFHQSPPRHSSTAISSTPTGSSGFDGAALPAGIVAPNFTLTDQDGRSVSLKHYRGRVTVLTFLYSTCGAACVLIAQQIRGALDELHTPPAVLIVSADPGKDTPASVRRFLKEVSLTGRVNYLTGPPARLRQVWRAYRVTPASAGRKTFAHFASVLLVDPRGEERVVYQQEQLTPEALAHDIGKLAGDPASP